MHFLIPWALLDEPVWEQSPGFNMAKSKSYYFYACEDHLYI